MTSSRAVAVKDSNLCPGSTTATGSARLDAELDCGAYIVVETSACISKLVQIPEGVVRREVFELHEELGENLRHRLHELFHELVHLYHPRMSVNQNLNMPPQNICRCTHLRRVRTSTTHTEIQGVFEEFLGISPEVEADRQGSGGFDSSSGDIEVTETPMMR